MKSVSVRNVSKIYAVRGNKNNFKEFLQENIINFFSNEIKTNEGRFYALKNISFELDAGDIMGIIGDNGAGKSTLLKIISGVSQPTEGEVEIQGKISSILEIGTGFHMELTGRENIFLSGSILGMTKEEIKNQYESIVEFSGLGEFINVAIKRYSSGMYVRLAFSVLAHLNTDIILLDEIIYVGDAEFRIKSYKKIKQLARSGKTILIVSHDLASISDLCPKCLLLVKGEMKLFGKTSDIVREYLDESLQKFINASNAESQNKKMKEEMEQLQQKIEQMDRIIREKEEVLSSTSENEQRLSIELKKMKEEVEELYRIREGIRMASKGNEVETSTFVQEQNWPDEVTAPGNEMIRLRRIALTTRDKKPFRQDEDILLEFEYWKYVEEPITIGLIAFYNFSQIAFGTTSSYGEHHLINNRKIGFFKNVCIINKYLLNHGLFSFSFFFLNGAGEVIYSMHNTLMLRIEHSPDFSEKFNYKGNLMAPFMPGFKWFQPPD